MANVPAGFWRCVQTWSAHTPNTSFGMNVCPNSVGGVDVLADGEGHDELDADETHRAVGAWFIDENLRVQRIDRAIDERHVGVVKPHRAFVAIRQAVGDRGIVAALLREREARIRRE